MSRRLMLALLALAVASGALFADAAGQLARAAPGSSADWRAVEDLLDESGSRHARLDATLLAIGRSGADAIIVRANEVPLTPAEMDAIVAFAEDGGRAIVLAEPALAARFGMEIAPVPIHATDGGALRAEGDRAPLLPDARPLLGSGEIALATRTASFVDADADGRAGASDVAGPFAVARSALEGRVLVLSTTFLLDEAALQDPDTRAYARDLLAERLPAGSLVALDDTRAPGGIGGALLAAGVRAGELVGLRAILAATALALAAAAWPTRRATTTPRETRIPLREEQA